MAARHCMLAKHLIETVLDYTQLMFFVYKIRNIIFNLDAWVIY